MDEILKDIENLLAHVVSMPMSTDSDLLLAELEALYKKVSAQQSVEPTLDTSPVFVPKPCVICGQMVCNH